MTQDRIESATAQSTVPTILASWLTVFRPCFTAPVWSHILVLVGGAVLAPGKRTVTQALRVMGLADKPGFGRYHEVLNRARWDARDVAASIAASSPGGAVAQRRCGDRRRRYHRAALGREDQGTRHLSRSGTVIPWPLRQDQRLTLAVAGGDVAGPVRRPAVGTTVPDRAGAVSALERGAREAAQGADRLGKAGDIANQTLAAGSPRDCRRRQRFLGIGTHRRCASARLLDHPVASRRQFVRAGTETPKGSNGTACTERQTPAQTQRRPRRSEHCMDIRHAD